MRTQRLVRAVSVGVAVAIVGLGLMPGVTLSAQHDPPWADAMWAHYPGANGLDTTGTMNGARNAIVGGYASYSSNPNHARNAMSSSYAQDDAIWWMAGHGAAGYISTYNSTNGVTYLYVSSTAGNCSGNSNHNACLSEFTSSIHDIRVMIFQSCNSGDAIANGDRLPKRAHDVDGVDASVGFGEIINFSANESDLWAKKVPYHSYSGQTVYNAVWAATGDVFAAMGGYSGYDSLITYGASTTSMYPAGYGT